MQEKNYLKGRLEEIKKSMTEEAFFASEAFRKWISKMVLGITGRNDIKLLLGKGLPTATDNKTIWTDTSFSEEEQKLSFVDRVLMIIGSVSHEIFHCLYTDFNVLKKMNGDKLRHHFHNIVEDSAIEYIGCAYYSGWAKVGLEFSNKVNFKQRPSLSELAKKGKLNADLYTEACLTYAIMGKIKGRLPKSIATEFRKAMPLLDAGRLAVDSKGRLYYSDRVLEIGKEFFKEKQDLSDLMKMFPHMPQGCSSENAQKAPQSGSSGNPQEEKTQTQKNAEKTKEKLQKGQKKSDQGSPEKAEEKNSKESGSGSDSDKKEDSGKKGDEGEGQGSDGFKEENGEDSGKDAKGRSQGDSKDDSKETEDGSGGAAGDESKDDESGDKSAAKDGEGNGSDKDDKSDEDSSKSEKGEGVDNEDADGEDGDGSGTNSNDVDYDADNDYEVPDLSGLEESLKDLGEEVAKELYDNAEDKKIAAKIQKFNTKMKDYYGDMHKHIKVYSNYASAAGDEEKYMLEAIQAEIGLLTKSLARKLTEVIRYNESFKRSGLFSGKPNNSQLYRLDQRVFCKRVEKSDEADLAIVVLCDESRSMRSDYRIQYARKASLILYEVCKTLKIPFSLIGHRATSGQPIVCLDHLVDWDARGDQRANIMKLHARDNTREGVSVRYAAEYLMQRPEQDKILFVISDGEPTHHDGRGILSGKPVANDIISISKKYRDVRIIGVAIGDGQTEIKKLYKECLEIQELSKLPVKLANLIKDNLLKGA